MRILEDIEAYLVNTWWWFIHRLHPSHRYHKVDTGLPPGYYDPDIRLTCALFEETLKFVEYEENETRRELSEEWWLTLSKAAEWWRENKEQYMAEGFGDSELDAVRTYHLKNIVASLGYMWY